MYSVSYSVNIYVAKTISNRSSVQASDQQTRSHFRQTPNLTLYFLAWDISNATTAPLLWK